LSTKLRYHKTAERPSAELWLLDDDGTLIDFSTGYTFSFKIGTKGSAALLTKTSGITGAAGAGSAPTGTANVVVAWSAGELAIAAGSYFWQLTATSSALDRTFEGMFEIVDVIT
jgi:hypothetical protein